MKTSWTVEPDVGGKRLDQYLAGHLEETRNQVQSWIRAERVRVDGEILRSSHRLQGGEKIECDPPAAGTDDRIEPEEGSLDVLYEDQDLAVLNKPPNLTVHPGAGQPRGTLVHRVVAKFPQAAGVGGPGRPGIVHRLDKDTSGLMVIALNNKSYQKLSRAFSERKVRKLYLGIVFGELTDREGVIDRPIGRDPRRRVRMAIRPDGRQARTEFRCLARASGISLVEMLLVTGRTHQIRVHLKSIGHPLVGDPLYGEARWKAFPAPARNPLATFERPALHAWHLALAHPTTAEPLAFDAPIPGDLCDLWSSVTNTAPLADFLKKEQDPESGSR